MEKTNKEKNTHSDVSQSLACFASYPNTHTQQSPI